jgi:hypothetical protein
MLRRLSLLFRTFTPVEEAVLAAVANALPESSAESFRQQVACINKVQRTLDWTEICFYSTRGGRVRWPEAVLFPNRGDFQLAIVEYRIGSTRYRTMLHAVAGHIFSFVTRPPIKEASFGRVEDLAVVAVGDPLTPAAGDQSHQRFLPSSYLAWWQTARGAHEHNAWLVLEPDKTYVVHLSADDYVVLAERAGEEWLVVPEREGDGYIHHCVLGAEPRALEGDFARCLEL